MTSRIAEYAFKEENNMKKRIMSLFLSLCLLVGLLPVTVIAEVGVVEVDIEQSSIYLTVGESATLDVTVWPQDATDKSLTWAACDSEGTDVVSVVDGVVTATAPGVANVYAYSVDNDNCYDWCDVYVGEYAITFDANGGAFPDEEGEPTLTTMTLPTTYYGNISWEMLYRLEDCVWEGHALCGWAYSSDVSYVDVMSGEAEDFIYTYYLGDTYFDEDTTLYAVWGDALTPQDFTVKREEDGSLTVTPDGTLKPGEMWYWLSTDATMQTEMIEEIFLQMRNGLIEDMGDMVGDSLMTAADYLPIVLSMELGSTSGIFFGSSDESSFTVSSDSKYMIVGKISESLAVSEAGFTFHPFITAGAVGDCTNLEAGETASNYIGKTFTVTFDPNGGALPQGFPGTLQTQYGCFINRRQMPIPTRDGYNFAGWFLPDGTQPEMGNAPDRVMSYMFYADTTLKAGWGASYAIHLDVNGGVMPGGSSTDMMTDDAGYLEDELPEPTKAGYVFLGWFKPNSKNPVDEAHTIFIEPTTLTAKWAPRMKEQNFTAKKNENGTVTVTPSGTLADGETWAWFAFNETAADFVAQTYMDGDYDEYFMEQLDTVDPDEFPDFETLRVSELYMLVFKQLIRNAGQSDSFTLESRLMNMKNAISAKNVTSGVETEASFTVPSDAKMVFVCKTTVKNGAHMFTALGGAEVMDLDVGETVSNRVGKESQVTFTYASGDGVEMPLGFDNPASTKNFRLPEIPEATRAGYALNGWYFPDNETRARASTPFFYDTTLTAKWVPQYTVTFDPGEGATVDGEATLALPTNGDKRVSLEYIPEAERADGATFAGWYLPDGTRFTRRTVFQENTTLTARFAGTVEITFDPGDGHMEEYDMTGYTTGGRLSGLPTAYCEGSHITGWFLEDGTTKVTTATLFFEDTTVYAQYEADEPCAYPWGTDMGYSYITLNTDIPGETYQWQVSATTNINSEFTDIEGETDMTMQFEPEDHKWYRCMVDYGLPTETYTRAIQAFVAKSADFAGNCESGRWYLGNGAMAYSCNSSGFDIVGTYTKGSKTYWAGTSYSSWWRTTGSGSSLRFSFDPENDRSLLAEATVQPGYTGFAYDTDTMLADYNITQYSDSCSLKAVRNPDTGMLKQIQMVGARSLDDASDEDVAFVVTPITPCDCFYIGYYNCRRINSYNSPINADSWDGYAPDMIASWTYDYATVSEARDDGFEDAEIYATEIQGGDSGCALSWMDRVPGEKVSFGVSVGTVAQTGADIGQAGGVSYDSISVPMTDPDTFYALYDATGTVLLRSWIRGDGEELIFDNGVLDEEGGEGMTAIEEASYYVIKAILAENMDLSDPENPKPRPNLKPKYIVELLVNTLFDPLAPAKKGDPRVEPESSMNSVTMEGVRYPGYKYTISDENGAIIDYQVPTDGRVHFEDLAPGSTYIITVEKIGSDIKSTPIYVNSLTGRSAVMTDYVYDGNDLPTPAYNDEVPLEEGEHVNYYYSNKSFAGKTAGGTAWSGMTTTSLTPGTYYMVFRRDKKYVANSDQARFKVLKGQQTPPQFTTDRMTVTIDVADMGRSLEYSMDEGVTWENVPTLTDGSFTVTGMPMGTYPIWIRAKETKFYEISESTKKTVSENNTFSVAYNGNGGTNSPATVTENTPNGITIADGTGMTRRGYEFIGWNTEADGSGTSYTPGSMLYDGATLYAQWKANEYTVLFDANGGEGTMGSQTFNYDTAKKLSANTFTRENYYFAGWALSADGAVRYQNEASVKNIADSGDVTLYAVWTENLYSAKINIETPNGEQIKLTLKTGGVIVKTKTLPIEVEKVGTTFYLDYTFEGLVPGSYTVIATQTFEDGAEVTASKALILSGGNGEETLTLKKRGVNVPEPEITGEDTRPVIVGGLEEEAESYRETGYDVSVQMSIEQEVKQDLPRTATDAQKDTQQAIAALSALTQDTNCEYINIDIWKTITERTPEEGQEPTVETEKVTETDKVLEIVIPYDLTGKTVKVFRHHEGTTKQLTSLYSKPSGNFTDATFYADSATNNVYIYTSKFSVYAIQWEEYVESEVQPEAGGYDGSLMWSDSTAGFEDVPASAYYAPAVEWAVAMGIAEGKDEKHFRPDMGATRAQVVTYLWRAAGSPVVDYAMDMTDVPADVYYAEAVRWALANGVTKGVSATDFAPDKTCTRAQIVTLLARYSGVADGSTGTRFADVKKDAYYAAAVDWAVAAGVTQGKSATRFAPNMTCTRAQVVTFLYRLLAL